MSLSQPAQRRADLIPASSMAYAQNVAPSGFGRHTVGGQNRVAGGAIRQVGTAANLSTAGTATTFRAAYPGASRSGQVAGSVKNSNTLAPTISVQPPLRTTSPVEARLEGFHITAPSMPALRSAPLTPHSPLSESNVVLVKTASGVRAHPAVAARAAAVTPKAKIFQKAREDLLKGLKFGKIGLALEPMQIAQLLGDGSVSTVAKTPPMEISQLLGDGTYKVLDKAGENTEAVFPLQILQLHGDGSFTAHLEAPPMQILQLFGNGSISTATKPASSEANQVEKMMNKAQGDLRLGLISGSLSTALNAQSHGIPQDKKWLGVKQKVLADLSKGLNNGSLAVALGAGVSKDKEWFRVNQKLWADLSKGLNNGSLAVALSASIPKDKEWFRVNQKLQADLSKGLKDGSLAVALGASTPKDEAWYFQEWLRVSQKLRVDLSQGLNNGSLSEALGAGIPKEEQWLRVNQKLQADLSRALKNDCLTVALHVPKNSPGHFDKINAMAGRALFAAALEM